MDGEIAPPDTDTGLLSEAVKAAGEVALRYFKADPKVWTKPDGSPVSEADLAVDAALKSFLSAARPKYGWMSEEHTADIDIAARTFVIDPIDGTRAYLRGEPAWAVVAAVIEVGRPVAAAIYQPADPCLYLATAGGGATRDGLPVRVTDKTTLDGSEIALPGVLYRDGGLHLSGVKRAPALPSLALRLAKVAEGRFDGAITKAGPHHWDLAAADLLLVEAGGTLTNLSGELPRYDSLTTSHPPMVAASREFSQTLCRSAAAAFAALPE
ncbi:MAG: 3'(2'),5'-bisphosphate nucleotidase CysQ [Pseudomonadota bacterium]